MASPQQGDAERGWWESRDDRLVCTRIAAAWFDALASKHGTDERVWRACATGLLFGSVVDRKDQRGRGGHDDVGAADAVLDRHHRADVQSVASADRKVLLVGLRHDLVAVEFRETLRHGKYLLRCCR